MGNNSTIFWDFDGTLAYREGMWSGALLEALEKKGINHDLNRKDFKPYLSSGYPWHTPEEDHLHLSTSEEWWNVIENIFIQAYIGLGINSKKAEELAKLAHELYIDPESFDLYDDTLKTLKKLKEKNWNNIILSNHVPELNEIVKGLGLDKYVTDCISSGRVGYEKPHSEIFRIALSTANNPERVWMIGDSIKADVKGANNLGIPAILVHKEGKNEVKYQANNLVEVREIIKENSKK
ncbi:HAD family hydrolase [Halanaerobacter jeridensis]|uniref:Hydrolase of the HAD superfamily n=1 Tax=Halanaerobacter jeridensis TaxID=706427 RepID=A0A939BQD4_9FIRM|nr:HAD family hydrolase [Halanaerobacter jeridensis]MBM7558172.1 putative hydrolase of the HAD superfamily [Halanaerobacter jeridensis]